MKTYHAVKAEIAKLEAKAESLRKNELKTVIAQVRKTIAEYGLTAADLGLGRAPAKGAARRKSATVGVAKYRDPQSGQTWTGRGRPPTWILAAKDRSAFLIDGASAGAPAAKKGAARKGRAKAAPAAKRGKGRAARKSGAVQIESGAATQ
jgi:DNA-binding protein H-NS